MATVTGGGAGNAETTLINVGTNDRNGVAQALANVISTRLQNGTYARTTAGSNPPSGLAC